MFDLGSLKGVPIALSLLLIAGCADYSSGPTTESAAVGRLAQQGFKLVADGRGTDGASALRYSGNPAAVIRCGRPGGRYGVTDQALSVALPDGRTVSESGIVDAYVIVANDGSRSGLYMNTVTREVRNAAGDLTGREVEIAEFTPGSTGRFRNGLICKPRS